MSLLTGAFENNILQRTENDSAFGWKFLIKKSKVYAPTETEVVSSILWDDVTLLKITSFIFWTSRLKQTVWALRIPASSLNSCHLPSAAVTESQLKPRKKETHRKECFFQELRQPTKLKGKKSWKSRSWSPIPGWNSSRTLLFLCNFSLDYILHSKCLHILRQEGSRESLHLRLVIKDDGNHYFHIKFKRCTKGFK